MSSSQRSLSRPDFFFPVLQSVRALAHKGGMSAREAAGKLNGYRTVYRAVRLPPPPPIADNKLLNTHNLQKPWLVWGYHLDRHQEDGLSYISHVKVDDGMTLHLEDEDVYDFKVDFPVREEGKRQTDMTVSLIDIAKPARRKGKSGFLSGGSS